MQKVATVRKKIQLHASCACTVPYKQHSLHFLFFILFGSCFAGCKDAQDFSIKSMLDVRGIIINNQNERKKKERGKTGLVAAAVTCALFRSTVGQSLDRFSIQLEKTSRQAPATPTKNSWLRHPFFRALCASVEYPEKQIGNPHLPLPPPLSLCVSLSPPQMNCRFP